MRTPVVAIFDIGKTNKKLFLINESYTIVWENTIQFTETKDEDGFPCEDIEELTHWVKSSLHELFELIDFQIKAVNFSTYGASFINLNKEGKIITPLYNYLKPYPEHLYKDFYDKYDSDGNFSVTTASPKLGSLNSGLQLYRLKYDQPEIFSQVHYSLHMPQYLSYLITKQVHADITSIGCHTALWDYNLNEYHEWLKKENISMKLPRLFSTEKVLRVTYNSQYILVGIGLHDSSAAIIPYIKAFDEPFILISTGTWCITLNPFNKTPLTINELEEDFLCYMEYRGSPIKASRLFAGYEHELQTKRLAEYFGTEPLFYKNVDYNRNFIKTLGLETARNRNKKVVSLMSGDSGFGNRDLQQYKNYEIAYHQLMMDIIELQVYSTKLIVQESTIKMIFVDGGFSRNPIYMNLLADAFPDIEVYASKVAQASAIGAAQSIHKFWNTKQLPKNIINLKKIIRE